VGDGITTCVTLRTNSACPTLGDFCYNYGATAGCQYAIADQPQTCCPTTITTTALIGKH
jgi:hypothetical protein